MCLLHVLLQHKSTAMDYDTLNLITKSLAGECTAEEQAVLSELLLNNPECQATYEQFKRIWAKPAEVLDSYDVDAAWNRVQQHISKPYGHILPKKVFWPRRAYAYVAGMAALLLLAVGVWFLYKPAPAFKTVASGASTDIKVTMPDGSLATLNRNSTLKFPEKFGSTGRETYFWGEGFFKIKPDPSSPFVIGTEFVKIKVLGTSFNVKALKGDDLTEVTVNTGKVLLFNENTHGFSDQQLVLVPGETGICNHATGKLYKAAHRDANVLSWKTSILVFNQTDLNKVLETIGNKYNVQFQLQDAQLAKLKLTATFDHESLNSILEVLTLVHKLHFEQNGDIYLVSRQ